MLNKKNTVVRKEETGLITSSKRKFQFFQHVLSFKINKVTHSFDSNTSGVFNPLSDLSLIYLTICVWNRNEIKVFASTVFPLYNYVLCFMKRV